MKDEFPKRKSTRLKYYDYSSVGAYFVTICARDRKRIFSEIVKCYHIGDDSELNRSVGEGLAPPVYRIRLKPCGEIAEEQLLSLENRYSNVTIEDYVIMPDHIHAIVFLHKTEGGTSSSPSLDDVICAFKSLTSRLCKQQYGVAQIFQRSYAEHIIRDKEDYEVRKKYIYENPMKWFYKYLNDE